MLFVNVVRKYGFTYRGTLLFFFNPGTAVNTLACAETLPAAHEITCIFVKISKVTLLLLFFSPEKIEKLPRKPYYNIVYSHYTDRVASFIRLFPRTKFRPVFCYYNNVVHCRYCRKITFLSFSLSVRDRLRIQLF